MQQSQEEVLDLNATEEVLREFLNQRGQALKKVMPLAMRNLAIAHGEVPPSPRRRLGQAQGVLCPRGLRDDPAGTRNTLDAPARPHVLCILEVKPSGVVLMEGNDVGRKEEQIKNVAQWPLPILDTTMYPERYFQGPKIHCRLCGLRHRGNKMALCDTCQDDYHIWCIDRPLL